MLRVPTNFSTPFYETNKDWYYFDFRSMRNKLTDKATKEALDSYYNFMLDFRENLTPEHLKELIKNDLEDYAKNKNRYGFTTDDDGVSVLTSIDGKEIDIPSVMFTQE